MSVDALEQFRNRKAAALSATATAPTGVAGSPDVYAAFAAKDRVERLQIVTREAMQWPAYHCLLNVTSDGTHGTNFMLLFSFLGVVVKGKNLQGVVSAIAAGTCSFIQEFDAKKWPAPAAGEPVIESIEYVSEGNADSEEVAATLKRA
jgi:hypothetical protein